MKKRIPTFVAGMLTTALISALGISALAATGQLTITVDPINIQVNGTTFTPTDAQGASVPVFAYGGTTYAPLRALAEAYGLEVGYDAKANMATVGETVTPATTPTPAPTATPKPTPALPSATQLRAEENARHDAAIEELESQRNDYKRIISNKISELRSATTPYSGSDSSYESKKSSLLSDLSRLQSKINSLKSDDSREAQSLLRAATSELAEKQQELDALQEAYSVKGQIDALEDSLDQHKQSNDRAVREENQLHRDNLSEIGY